MAPLKGGSDKAERGYKKLKLPGSTLIKLKRSDIILL